MGTPYPKGAIPNREEWCQWPQNTELRHAQGLCPEFTVDLFFCLFGSYEFKINAKPLNYWKLAIRPGVACNLLITTRGERFERKCIVFLYNIYLFICNWTCLDLVSHLSDLKYVCSSINQSPLVLLTKHRSNSAMFYNMLIVVHMYTHTSLVYRSLHY